ncbi:DUF1127 domain-containing protein [Aliiroseovarius sp. S2029]|uniref:DUF1127 domain-containing protein n=1 Tax=Aliiroseovarius sp. S2029 TaxID=2936988 RepID=UPI0020BE4828|nr:DUF1127 domain-containing protein [Aliiroseovarius sp. S2029]MCK8483940.1 DUF1127 domain-containing protein [Aliiroseovarius sp. S2029]
MTMNVIETGAKPHPTKALLAATARLISSATRRRRDQRVMHALAQLPDHLLRDIGMERVKERRIPAIRLNTW